MNPRPMIPMRVMFITSPFNLFTTESTEYRGGHGGAKHPESLCVAYRTPAQHENEPRPSGSDLAVGPQLTLPDGRGSFKAFQSRSAATRDDGSTNLRKAC